MAIKNQKRRQLERINEVSKNQHGQRLCRGQRTVGSCSRQVAAGMQNGGRNKPGDGDCQWNAAKGGKLRKIGALFFAIVQKHDYEDKQHHDGAAVDDDLHGGNKFGAQQRYKPASATITTISESAL